MQRLETLLVHPDASHTVMPDVLEALHEEGVEIRGERTCEIFAEAIPAEEADWARSTWTSAGGAGGGRPRRGHRPHPALRLGSHRGHRHQDDANGQDFLRRVNSSTVGINCSTAFSDGYRLGLGAEIGISTSKLHAYGPMGLEGLTTLKFVLYGDGQIRE